MSALDMFKRSAAPVALSAGLAFGLAANANAAGLIPGQCYSKADAQAILKQEGQSPIIMGSRLTLGKERPANVFFLNNLGYGYNIEGDAPLGVPARNLCVRAAYKDVYLNSPNNPEIPDWAKGIKATGNGIDLEKAYQNGARAILGARTYTQKADGTEILGRYLVVLASVNDKIGDVWSVDSLGRPDTSFDMEGVGITQKMADILNGRQATSSGQSTVALAAK